MATEQLVEQVAENVAENLEGAAVVTREGAAVVARKINPKSIGYSLVGLGIGVAVGFVIGYRWNRAKIRAEAFKESEEEVEKIRTMYRDSMKVVVEKPALDDVIEDKGYGNVPVVEERARPTRPPVPAGPAPEPDIPKVVIDMSKSKDDGWDFEAELASRSVDHPYIIHQDEFNENSTGYRQETLTWYAGDDVLTDEQEEPIDKPDELVDLNHMSRFGHGSDDFNVLFVRNDQVQMEYEICRMPTSYEEEVKGLTNGEPD